VTSRKRSTLAATVLIGFVYGTAAAQDNAAGGAIVRGRITAADNGQPLRRALVTAAAESGSAPRTANTNADGRYEIRNLPEGRYRVSVVRSGYLPLEYGQHRPLEAARLLDVGARDVDRVDFSLPRTGSIAGRIADETGEPIAGVIVIAAHPAYLDGQRRLAAAAGPVRTDDAGQYKIAGLVAGTYVVEALARDTWTHHGNGRDEVMGYQPTYYPGTGDPAEARQVAVGAGDRIAAIDFAILPAATATVSGTAFDAHGQPLAGRVVGLTQTIRNPGVGGANFSIGNAKVASDGTFAIRNVPPGEYKLQARAPSSGPGGDDDAAAQTVVVNGTDVGHVALVTAHGWSIAGRIRTESGVAPQMAPDRARLIATVPDATNPRGGPPGGKTRIDDDWTFSVNDLFGAARLRLSLPPGWAMKAMLQDGRDVTDAALVKKSGGELSGVEIVVTDRVTSVGGRITDGSGAAADGTVIVFAVDPQKWSEDSRFVGAARPDDRGTWQIRGLPPGDYYAAAIDYVQDRMWNDPEFLESRRGGAQRVTLTDGGTATLTLTPAAAAPR